MKGTRWRRPHSPTRVRCPRSLRVRVWGQTQKKQENNERRVCAYPGPRSNSPGVFFCSRLAVAASHYLKKVKNTALPCPKRDIPQSESARTLSASLFVELCCRCCVSEAVRLSWVFRNNAVGFRCFLSRPVRPRTGRMHTRQEDEVYDGISAASFRPLRGRH